MPLPLPNKFKDSALAQHWLRPLWLRAKAAWQHRTSPKHTIIAKYTGQQALRNSAKLCLFVTYDPQNIIDDYVVHYISQLAHSGFEIFVISTSAELPECERAKVSPYCAKIIHRKNLGLDFGSWKSVMDLMGTELFQYKELLLANDSIFGPFSSLNRVFDTLRGMGQTFCGLTDNLEYEHHLQSYFLYFKEAAFRSAAFSDFWADVRILENKNEIIQKYEIGISRHFLNRGFDLGAVVPYKNILSHCLNLTKGHCQFHEELATAPRNATLLLWEHLLKDFSFPFIKTDVLKRNVTGNTAVAQWRDQIPIEGRALIPVIERHLQRINQKAPELQ